jgi:hypothetical protein
VVAIDTNVLVYAQRAGSTHHRAALALLTSLAEGAGPWGLPWPSLGEYLRLVTHPLAWQVVTPMSDALANLEALLSSPSLRLLEPTERHLPVLREVLTESGATGNRVRDAEICALCLQHGVRELFTADRDFRRFTGLRVTNPFA